MTPLSDVGLIGRRVLVADDVARTRWSHVGLLRDAGARVTEARDGVEALALARANAPDLILADMAMPRLDGLGLCAALREEPTLGGVPVVLLSDGAPPQAVLGADIASRPLVEAVMAALARRGPGAQLADPEPAAQERGEPDRDPPADPADATERENIRAQSTVAMHREPANRPPKRAHAVWRLRANGPPDADGTPSGFGAELSVMSRILGIGFLSLLAATVGVIVWRIAVTPSPLPAPSSVVQPAPSEPTDSEPGLPPAEEKVRSVEDGVAAFSGELRPGVDPTMGVLAGQGVLQLDGPAAVKVSVDGEDVGVLPLSLPLDEGRHRVRYRFENSVTDRFYYLRSGSTRALRVVTRPGGFVDAR